MQQQMCMSKTHNHPFSVFYYLHFFRVRRMKNIIIQPQRCIHLCTTKPHLGFQQSLFLTTNFPKQDPRRLIVAQCHRKPNNKNIGVKGKKENVWSIDNEMAKVNEEREVKEKGKQRRRKGGKRVVEGRRSKSGRIMVSGAMLMEVETVLQTQVTSFLVPLL